ncbi:MAG: anion transporter [Burkholderiaceae bacterium]|nr:anion transporter [Burkholderiaceae bacterium]
MDAWVLAIFAIVYLGMILGGLPRLHLDRTGVALLGAIAVVGLGVMTPEAAARSIHLPTILLLFSFMVVSAQLRLGGFYGWVTAAVSGLKLGPAALLGVVIAVVALLSAVFSNDIVCLAMAPMLADACARKRLNPVPFLLALACAANIGSALTLIGNPQNMLIGETLKLPFGAYLLEALVPVSLSLLALWAWLARGLSRPHTPAPSMAAGDDCIALDRWQSAKGVAVAAALLAVFLFTDWPRDVAALVGAGLLLLSQRFHSSKVMREIDWELLVLFMGLFVVNHALELTGLSARGVAALAQSGVDLSQPAPLFASTLLLSNLVSNVPAVMLLLPLAREPWAGPMLALVSTLAGNLLLVGSIANLIVVDAARRQGIAIDWRMHARVGVPVGLLSLLLAAGWFAWRV